ncbi:general stress protein (plasmid) [Priestia aryabhattai]|uniref:general stress protein n=1 Tax=Priestia aryabhattai TaxID=412384 RepID=UPI002452866E|nr:general stress protein [Priestia aryabhattai]MDH3135415.1 general stress protein [Priestia aryabhattai]
MDNIIIAKNGAEAKEAIETFLQGGFTRDDIYLFTYNKENSQNLTNVTDTSDVGLAEQHIFDSIANVFRSREEELRAKMHSLGLSEIEIEQCVEKMDRGDIVIIALKVA